MAYYLEVWLRGYAKDFLRGLSINDEELYHPHITLVRPFEVLGDDQDVKARIVGFCRGRAPIRFSLEGKGKFDGGIEYVPVVDYEELLQFNDGLEQLLEGEVRFAPRLNEVKILHATVEVAGGLPVCPRIDQHMLRLTGIHDKRIWFSYDFVTQEVLDREKSLDKGLWDKTMRRYLEEKE